MSARIATGRAVEPRLIKSIDGVIQPSGAGAPLDVDQANLRRIRQAMYSVVNDRGGTAGGSRIVVDEMRMAGKTGTAQVRSVIVKNSEVPWEKRDHALFVNFAPYDNPKYAVAVVVEHGGGGSKAAAPIARDITLQALYGGEPPLSAYPSGDRNRISAQQRRLRKVRPVANIGGKDQA
jgi:penicillin-binding protein 2